MSPPAGEALLAAGYGLGLFVMAIGLDLLARHSHQRSLRYRTAGFAYDHTQDSWLCPEGERLHRSHYDHESRVVRYRARAHVCNACPAKPGCTDSDEGREVARALDPWPHSEAGRFHRGIAVFLLGLAAGILIIGAARNHDPADLLVLAPSMLAVGIALPRMAAAFTHAPSGFPEGEYAEPAASRR